MGQHDSKTTTTGHVWDDDLQELTNPLPRWWLWTFYLTVIFSVVYWLMYPAWPVGKSYTKGVEGLNTIKYTATTKDGKEVQKETHWNMRSKLLAETNAAEARQKVWFDKVAATSYEDLAKDAELMQFVNSAGKTLFSDNCAPCHQAGGQGKISFSPNLTDDYWQFGGTYEKIHETINGGRVGYMPARGAAGNLTDEQITNVANYVLSLSGEPHDAVAATAGNAIFNNEGGCIACHGPDAKGIEAMGSANLTDKIWLWPNVPGQTDAAAKLEEVRKVVTGGLNRGVMPAWGTRLKPEQVKLLTVYVHDSLGGGK